MGFFDSLFGGSESKSKSESGWSLLPDEIKIAFQNLAGQSGDYMPRSGGSDLFRPIGQTAGEQKALGSINAGFTPTEQTLSSDIAMQMNPFDKYVIDPINREAAGNNSILTSALTKAGQYGSNRGLIGANDIENTRLSRIGQLKQGQYNTALNNALTTLTNSRRADAAGQMSGGEFERNLDLQSKQAPISNLTALAKILGVLPTSGGSSQTSNTSTSPGMFGNLGSIASGIGSIF